MIVLTRGTRRSLAAALRSIGRQDYAGPMSVLVVADRPERRLGVALRGRRPVRGSVVHVQARGVPRSTVTHVARLRNLALAHVDAPLVAFLDDDNAWDNDHLSSLFTALSGSGACAAHSWRRLVDPRGHETVPTRFPWLPAGPGERDAFAACRALGVMSARDSVVRDAASLPWRGHDFGMVDLGEWLFRRRTLQGIGFATAYSDRERAHRVGEDDKLLADVRERRLKVACSARPTLRYRLGGFSNR